MSPERFSHIEMTLRSTLLRIPRGGSAKGLFTEGLAASYLGFTT